MMRHIFRSMFCVALVVATTGIAVAQQADEPLFPVAGEANTTYIDRSGKVVLTVPYSGGGRFSDGLARVNVDRQLGYIDRTGKLVIGPLRMKAVISQMAWPRLKRDLWQQAARMYAGEKSATNGSSLAAALPG